MTDEIKNEAVNVLAKKVAKIETRQIYFFCVILFGLLALCWFIVNTAAKPGTDVVFFGVKYTKDGDHSTSRNQFCNGRWVFSAEYTKIHNITPEKSEHWVGKGGAIMSDMEKNGELICRVIFWNGIQNPENSDDQLITVVRGGEILIEQSTGNPKINQGVTFTKLVRTGKSPFENTKTSELIFRIESYVPDIRGIITGKIESDKNMTEGKFTFTKE